MTIIFKQVELAWRTRRLEQLGRYPVGREHRLAGHHMKVAKILSSVGCTDEAIIHANSGITRYTQAALRGLGTRRGSETAADIAQYLALKRPDA